MPLSEGEQRILEQMERALHAEDPKLASALKQGNQTVLNGRKFALGILVFVVGMGVLVGGVATELVPLGVVGFFFMLIGVLIVGRAFDRSGSSNSSVNKSTAGGSTPSAAATTGGFMDKMEERWRRRNEGDGF